ncbi:MAG: hypothetical protein NUW01_07225 [Gemmatimonadaceae bacterium]|nr:hypothetical protein [Gemmatimonadaceae bacterium]
MAELMLWLATWQDNTCTANWYPIGLAVTPEQLQPFCVEINDGKPLSWEFDKDTNSWAAKDVTGNSWYVIQRVKRVD